MDQFTPVRLEGYDEPVCLVINFSCSLFSTQFSFMFSLSLLQVLITKHGALDQGRFLDPRNSLSFCFDHFRNEASDVQPYDGEIPLKSWRNAIDSALSVYVKEHYPTGNYSVRNRHVDNGGINKVLNIASVLQVYTNTDDSNESVIACIEGHQYQPHNYWYVLCL